jgi:hypothetical protein
MWVEREATLEELLEEPIIGQIMASYNVHIDEIRRLFREVRIRSLPSLQTNEIPTKRYQTER